MERQENIQINGEDKDRYLRQLDLSLDVLAKSLVSEKDPIKTDAVISFAEQNEWDMSRLPADCGTYRNLAQLVDRVRREYNWFDWKTFSGEPTRNFGYFEVLDVSTRTGLPWVFNFTELHRLKRDASDLLGKAEPYADSVRKLRSLLLHDTTEIDGVKSKARDLHREAMKRSFLDKIKGAELLGWESSGYSLEPSAKKLVELGPEELWEVTFIRYSPVTSQFHMYVLHTWQDGRDKQLVQKNGSAELSAKLLDTIKFGEQNTAWYMLTAIDKKFKSMHPVHLARGVLGPFENRYLTEGEVLPVTKELLTTDPGFNLLRLSMQYTFAPNSEVVEKESRQVVYTEDWRDEVLLVPARYSAKVNSSVEGTRVRVLEM